MATFVLVHGMWHGGWCWQKLRPLLEAAGHKVYTPTLTGLGERAHLNMAQIDFDIHVQDVLNVLKYEDLNDVLLCGHSYGAGVVLAVAAQARERLMHLISVDGLMPSNGHSYQEAYPRFYERLRDLALGSGNKWWVPVPPDWTFGITKAYDLAWVESKLTPFPIHALETPVTFQLPAESTLLHTFITCTLGQTEENLVEEKKALIKQGWYYRTLHTGHDAMITQPQKLADLLLELA